MSNKITQKEIGDYVYESFSSPFVGSKSSAMSISIAARAIGIGDFEIVKWAHATPGFSYKNGMVLATEGGIKRAKAYTERRKRERFLEKQTSLRLKKSVEVGGNIRVVQGKDCMFVEKADGDNVWVEFRHLQGVEVKIPMSSLEIVIRRRDD